MKILIIGGTGILSTAVVDECILRGYSVTIVNRGNRPEVANPKATFIKCDVRDEAQLKEFRASMKSTSFDAVVDFLVYTEAQLRISLNYFSPLAKQYVFISSAQVYNTSIKGILTEESPKPQSLWSYSVNKLACENALVEYCTNHHKLYTIIRPAVNYDGTRIPYGIFPPMGYHWTLVERIKHGKPIITWNKGENRLNLTRVEDFAFATVGLLGNPKANNEAFNVAGDNVYSWMEVLYVLGDLVGKKPVTIDFPVQFYANELPDYQKEELIGGRANDMVCSIEKLRSVLPDFTPKYALKEGIKKTLDYYQEHGYLYGIDYSFDGDTDRIIKKYCKKQHLDNPYPFGFIDYLSNHRKFDKKAYYYAYIKDNKLFKFALSLKSKTKKLF